MQHGVILLRTEKDHEWKQQLNKKLPQLDVRCWPEVGEAEQIDYALLWNPPDELFLSVKNLKVIYSIGAGVDGITKVRTRPQDVPIVRLSDKMLTDGMVEYVVYAVLRIHRNMNDYDRMQNEKVWSQLEQQAAGDCRVGILGLGQLGTACAKALSELGYQVAGFSNSVKQLDNICSYRQGQFSEFLNRTDILVCLLPLTANTKHILNAETFSQLPHGASIINVGRGGHLVEADLIQALDSGQLAHAVLDVFETEPLPCAHPFWTHPAITLTPHIASQTVPSSAVDHIIDGIKRHQQGKPLKFLFNPELGY